MKIETHNRATELTRKAGEIEYYQGILAEHRMNLNRAVLGNTRTARSLELSKIDPSGHLAKSLFAIVGNFLERERKVAEAEFAALSDENAPKE
jgi:hypothetical protein